MHNSYEIHRFYASRPSAGDEFGAVLDRERQGAWAKCEAKDCQHYHHPDSDYCAAHALGEANEYLKSLSADDEDVPQAAREVKQWESVVLYEAATKEREAEAWYFMMLCRDQALNGTDDVRIEQEAA